MQYNIKIRHKPGILNKANALSQCPDFPQQIDSPLETAFPNGMFISETTLDPFTVTIMVAQQDHLSEIMTLATLHSLTHNGHFWLHDS